MTESSEPVERADESPFNGSLDTLGRIHGLIQDIILCRVNQDWWGMKENLEELLNEGQGCLLKAEHIKAWKDWDEIKKIPISVSSEGCSFDSSLPDALKSFSSWLRLKLYRHNLTMAKTSGSLDKMQLMYDRYKLKR